MSSTATEPGTMLGISRASIAPARQLGYIKASSAVRSRSLCENLV